MKQLTMSQRVQDKEEMFRQRLDYFGSRLRVCVPAIVKSFNADKQTITAQIAINERVFADMEMHSVKIKELLDVPIFMPRAGGYTLTMPVQEGDECLIVFGDNCFNSWYQNGGEDNEQEFVRRHSLSDGIALLGIWSQPRTLDDYSIDAVELRNDDGDTKISLKDGEVTIKATSINLGDESGVRKLIDERIVAIYNAHVHSGVQGGSGSTGVPTVPLTDATVASTVVQGK
jgi:hypothetical protein